MQPRFLVSRTAAMHQKDAVSEGWAGFLPWRLQLEIIQATQAAQCKFLAEPLCGTLYGPPAELRGVPDMPVVVRNAARWLSTEIRPLMAFGIAATVGAIAYQPIFGDPRVGKPALWLLSLLSGLVFGLPVLAFIAGQRGRCEFERSPRFATYSARIVWCMFTFIFIVLLFCSKTVVRAVTLSVLLTCAGSGLVLCILRVLPRRTSR